MEVNDFYVAIQFLLEDAMRKGWSLTKIEELGHDAIDEFIGVQDDLLNQDVE